MKLILIVITLLLLAGCASGPESDHPSGLIVEEIAPDKSTALAKQNLLQLTQVYDLSPFLYTKRIQFKTGVETKSHPVILLNTRFADQPKKLLSSFLHEEMQWWLTQNKINSTLAVKDLAKLYPNPPSVKNSSKNATYYRLIVCYLELEALKHYLGNKEARAIMTSMMKKDKLYPWTYAQVLKRGAHIRKIVVHRQLLPLMLR